MQGKPRQSQFRDNTILIFTIIFVLATALGSRKDERGVPEGELKGTIRTNEADLSPELAAFMGRVQRLTHKLSLSIANANFNAADFYLHESVRSLKEIQDRFPEYESWPVALLVDRFTMPRYDELQEALKTGRAARSADKPKAAFANLIRSCNECHVATQHAFINITVDSSVNPFNQDFKP